YRHCAFINFTILFCGKHLEMTKVHVGLTVSLSNMLKTVRKLKKLREKEKCQGDSQKINGLERHISVLGANF
ncbi:MAG: hypothetical protein QME12_04370, partial [Nanoarchaeota archaeon]|nr:hypothetical protein [Nanoarchaeota archaeon]